jgi:hypothetical protein
MLKSLVNQKGEIQYIEVIKITSLLAILFVILAHILQSQQSLANSAPALVLIVNLLMIIQGLISAYEMISSFITLLEQFAIKAIQGYQIITKKCLHQEPSKKQNKIKHKINIYLNYQVIRC